MGSKTIPLSQAPARPTTPMVGKQTTKIAGGAPTTQPLPRATVKLQPTGSPIPAAAPVSSVNVRTAALDDDDEINETPLNVMGWIALVASIAALIGVLACMDKIEFFAEQPPSDPKTAWLKAAEPEGIKLPMDFSPFDTKNENGSISSTYEKEEPNIPDRPNAP